MPLFGPQLSSRVTGNQDRFTDADRLFRRALDILEAQPTIDTPSVGFNEQYGRLYGQTLNDLGWIYSTQGGRAATPSAIQNEREEAERLLQRALAVREKALGPDDTDVGQTAFNLMNLYRDWGRLTEAEPMGRRALTIYERQKGAEDPVVGDILNTLSARRRLGQTIRLSRLTSNATQRCCANSVGKWKPGKSTIERKRFGPRFRRTGHVNASRSVMEKIL